jgi:heme exporter protein C
MRASWWKILAAVLVFYAIVGGLMLPVPRLNILNETIRNLYFHVPMWFGMIILFAVSAVYAVRYLRGSRMSDDIRSAHFLKIGVLFSILGMITGMEWAKFTWGEAWSNDPKQLSTAVCMLSYFAYLVLRSGMKDEEKRARISAVYNIFAFALLIPLLFILPRMVDSLHPSNGGNAGFVAYDLDSRMRLVFYPAVLGWTLLGVWITTQRIRLAELQRTDEMTQFDFQKEELQHA